MKAEGLEEIIRSTLGASYISSGYVVNAKKVGCPKCDTVYIKFHRDSDGTKLLAITPKEALIIISQLSTVLEKVTK